MTRNAWAFRVDPQRWVPVPGMDVLIGKRRENWIERATVVVGFGSSGQYSSVDELRQRCAAIADSPRGPESVMFVPVMEPVPVLLHMTTDSPGATEATRERWLMKATTTRSIDVSDIESACLADAVRIARVDVDTHGRVTYWVAFVAVTEDLGTVWHASTDQPLVAGQLLALGAEVFATVTRR